MTIHDDLLKRIKKNDEKVKEFAELLDTLSSTDDKRKALWKEIYNNSLTDRENAYALYLSAYTTFGGGQGEHVNVGPIMVKYLERMSKANEQLLKLAEIVRSTQEEEQKITPDDLFEKIND
jgi:hypothetical protein